jgi:DNA-binding NarL/FixJ family response regulator
MLKILIIDRHPVFCIGLSLILRKEFDVGEIMELGDISNYKPSTIPDLIIVGINDTNNNQNMVFVSYTKKLFPKARFILYDNSQSINMSMEYFKIGFHGYVPKNATNEEFLECVKLVLDGNYFICPKAFGMFMDYFVNFTTKKSTKAYLTPKEFEIAKHFANGMSTSSIAFTINRKMSTVSTTKNNIFKKLQINNIIQLKQALEEFHYY